MRLVSCMALLAVVGFDPATAGPPVSTFREAVSDFVADGALQSAGLAKAQAEMANKPHLKAATRTAVKALATVSPVSKKREYPVF